MTKYPTQVELQEVFELEVAGDKEILYRKPFIDKRSRDRGKIIINSISNHHSGYCHVTFKGRNIRYHQIIYILKNGDIPEGYIIDHKDNDKVNNHSSNLQLLTCRENSQGCINHRQNGKTCGCRFHIRDKKWYAHIKINGKQVHLGLFNTEREASQIYLRAVTLVDKFIDSKQFRKLLL